MKNIFQTIIRTSILPGALFFCSHLIHGAINDTLVISDTISYPAADSIRAKKLSLKQLDTIPDTKKDTIKEESLIIHDTIYAPDEKVRKKMFEDHSPHRATILSAVLPGLGQAYNGKYWKIPIIYGAGLALYYGFGWMGFDEWGWEFYHRSYLKFKEDYELEYYNPEGNKDLADLYKKNMSIARKGRDRITIIYGILYLANVVDAMADAYFYYFDISDDLSMKVMPSITTPDPFIAYNDYSLGVKLRFKF